MPFKITSVEIRVSVLLDGIDHSMQQLLAGGGWGMGPALPVLCSKITLGISSSLFSPSVNALLAVGMHINSSEEGSEGGSSLPLTLVRHDVVKTRTPASLQMKLHVMQLHCKQAETGQQRCLCCSEGGQWWLHELGHHVGGLTKQRQCV